MLRFEDDVVIAFLKTVAEAPKGSTTYDKVPGNLDPDTFEALSHFCHSLGYINRRKGTLNNTMIIATVTEKGRGYLSRNTR